MGIVFLPINVRATVGSNITKVQYSGDGVSTSFNFGTGGYSVPVYLNTDIQVYIEVNSTGSITQLTLNNQYSVTLTAVPYSLTNTVVYNTAIISLAGGSTPFGALPVGDTLIINRSIPYTNLLNITDYAATPAATWNQGYDRATMLAQQLYTLTQQAVLQPVSATTPISIPSAQNGFILCWSGTSLANCANNGSGTPIPIPIPNSDLATLTTAGLVNGSSLSILSGTPSGAGILPLANHPIGTSANSLIYAQSSGNVGIGSPNPTALLSIQGGNVAIGTAVAGNSLDVLGTVQATSFTGQAGFGLFGSSAVRAATTVFQAASDGWVTSNSGTGNNVSILSDSSATPSTVVSNCAVTGQVATCGAIVSKGNFYEITGSSNTGGTFRPLGS